ncbi:MAG: DJ-1/PfpI family protein [Clostridia bacterium]|nr:DJ-1/PfpI family protein [Clostridia bacterium]
MKVYLHLADGFEDIEAIATADILRRAEIDVKTVSITGKKEVTGAFKTKVVADILFEDADYDDTDMIILPGGMQGTKALEGHSGLKEQILSFSTQDKWIAAICAAPTILGKMGLLEGKAAICYPGLEQQLSGAAVTQESVVVDGKIITSRGPGTVFQFGLKLVEVLKGKELADILKGKMLIG